MNYNNKPGISILACVLLISTFLLVSIGVWKTTVYLVDFVVQKQVYIQKRYIIEGIMRLVVKDVSLNWQELHQILQQRNKEVTYSIKNLPITIEHLKNCSSNIMIECKTADMLEIKIALLRETSCLLNAHCNLARIQKNNTQYYFRLQDWYVGA